MRNPEPLVDVLVREMKKTRPVSLKEALTEFRDIVR
jgi:hypothetical protein